MPTGWHVMLIGKCVYFLQREVWGEELECTERPLLVSLRIQLENDSGNVIQSLSKI